MKLKTLVCIATLAAAATGAQANTYNLGALAIGDNYLALSENSVIGVSAGPFSDVFNFSLAATSALEGNAGILNFKKFQISDVSFAYSLYDSSNKVLASGNDSAGFSLASLASGNYHLDVTGATVAGSAITGGKYSGVLTVTAVPEPESYAMLLAGLGLMGTIARRRSKANAV